MILINYRDQRPIYEQIVERFKELIFKGVLEPDTQLPSVRNLAIELSINPNTIQRAYTELEHQGYIYSVKGKGSFVAESKQLKLEKQKELLLDFWKLIEAARAIGITTEQMSKILHEGFGED